MFTKTKLLCLFILVLFISSGYSQNSEGYQETTIFDEFPILTHCDESNRMDLFMVELMNNPDLTGYILMYRGSKDIFVRQSDSFIKRRELQLKDHLRLRNFDLDRIIFIDAGFWETNKFTHRVWIVPIGGLIPTPEDTVPKPIIPTNRPYLIEETSFDSFANSLEDKNQETEIDSETIEYEYSDEGFTETIETPEVEDEIYTESEEDITFVSNEFINQLNQNKTSRGVIFFYLDEEEYNLVKTKESLQAELQTYSQKNEIDLGRIRLIYGGYREYPRAEFWVVPKNSSDAIPSPEKKAKKETDN